jgi:ABC-type uncharacterized transport system substrate-binding protein
MRGGTLTLAAAGHVPRRRLLRGAARLALGGAGLPLLAAACEWGAPPPRPAVGRVRIGVLSTGTGSDLPEFQGLRRGLREMGYAEGQNLALEYRFAGGDAAVLPQLAAELVASKVDVVVAHGFQACLAAKEASTTIPIVFGTGNDPVALGFAASLARPGGNMTGCRRRAPTGLDRPARPERPSAAA